MKDFNTMLASMKGSKRPSLRWLKTLMLSADAGDQHYTDEQPDPDTAPPEDWWPTSMKSQFDVGRSCRLHIKNGDRLYVINLPTNADSNPEQEYYNGMSMAIDVDRATLDTTYGHKWYPLAAEMWLMEYHSGRREMFELEVGEQVILG